MGIRPNHAAKSLPVAKVEASGEKASITKAAIGPMPGIVRRRRAVLLTSRASRRGVTQSGSSSRRDAARGRGGGSRAITLSGSRER